MEEKIFKEIMKRAPFGYAYHKLVYNSEGQPEDYIFLDVNPAFEEMTGIKKEDILGKKVTEVLPGIREGEFDWVKFYGETVMNGEKREFTQYAEPLGRWYKVCVFSPQEDHFVTIFQEVTAEIERIKSLQEQQEKIRELTLELETVFNGTQDAMFLMKVENGEFRYIRNNIVHQKLLGFSTEEIRDKTPEEVVGEELAKKLKANYRRCLEAGAAVTYEETLNLPAGERHWLVTLNPVFEDGKIKYIVGARKDITLQKKVEKDLYLEKELFKTTLLSIGDGVIITDSEGKIILVNKTAEEITGFKEEEIKGRLFTDVFQLVNETTGKKLKDPITKVLKTGKTIGLANHTVLIAKDGRKIPIADTASPIEDSEGHTYGVVLVFRDVTEERKWEQKILYMSYHDALTGLYNRHFVNEEIKRIESSGLLPVSVIMADIDGLKLVNDAFGHKAGDRLLKKAAGILKKSCGTSGIPARWGGDEFIVLLPGKSGETAEKIVKKIKNQCLKAKDGEVNISLSLGWAEKRKKSESIEKIIEKAEELSYKQKLLGGRTYRSNIIKALLATLHAKTAETEEHCERLRDYCLQIGRKMNLSEKELNDLVLLAMLHDIGKVGIKESILNKPGPLTPEEWQEIKKHSEIGYKIVSNIPEVAYIAEYILYHHERWDGKGYPRGLKGDEIPLACRILAVVDAYDAMVSDRPYRKALNKDEAIREILKNSGTQFDPEVVEIFMECLDESL